MSIPSTLISSAQNREDLYLFALVGDIKKGFYVDVGANHATLHSVTKMFYDRGWKGINIEPNPILHKELKAARRRDINLNIGMSDKSGELLFRTYPHHDGLSTFSKEIMKLHEANGYPYEDSSVPVRTLASIFEEQKVTSIDFLKIDVEGYELEVVNGNDWKKYRPKVLVIEATVRHKLDPLLKKFGYHLEFFDGLNNYYVDDVCKNITIHNYAGRILGGGVYTQREIELIDTNRQLDLQLATAKVEVMGLKNLLRELLRSGKAYIRRKVSRFYIRRR